jgi:alpha-galactosidase
MIPKSPFLARVLLCALILMLGALSMHAQTDITGLWVFKAPRGDGTFSESYFELKQNGETITGNTVGGRAKLPVNDGAFRDGKVHFAISFTGRGGQKGGAPQTFTTIYEGTLQGDRFAMTMTGGRGGRGGRGPIAGEFERTTAEAAMPPAKLPLPELHDVSENHSRPN